MTTQDYPTILNINNSDNEEILKVLREIIRLRGRDITDFNNLNKIFLPGRSTSRVPSTPADTLADDQPGDIVNDGTFEYKLIDDAGDFKWDRRLLDFGW